jgi:hypothetical protein
LSGCFDTEVFAIIKEQNFIQFLRVYKHDFLNHLQVIQGYLQLKKPEQALRYVKEAITEVEEHGSIMRLKLPTVTFWLMLKELELKEQGINTNFTSNTDFLASEEQEEIILTFLQSIIEKIERKMGRLPYDKRKLGLSFTGQDILKLILTLPKESGINWGNTFKEGTYPKSLKLTVNGSEQEDNHVYQLEIRLIEQTIG